MAKYCTSCGKEIAEEVAFCTECGAKQEEQIVDPATQQETQQGPTPQPTSQPDPQPIQPAPQPTPQPAQQQNPQPTQQPTQQAPRPVQTSVQPVANNYNKVVGTGAYFGLMFLFSIPIVGLISVILMSFLPKNKNIKNYARAMLLWTIILFIITCIIIALCVAFANVFTDILNESTNGAAGDMINQFGELGDSLKELEGISEQLKNGGAQSLPLK